MTAHAALTAGLLDSVLLLLIVFEHAFPLPNPGTFKALATLAVDAADLSQLRAAGEQARHARMTLFVNDVAAGLTMVTPARRTGAKATTTDAPAGAAPTDFNQGIGSEKGLPAQGSPFQQQLRVANAGLVALARLDNTAALSALMLRIEPNDVECGLGRPTTSGPAIFIEVPLQDHPTTSAQVTANRLPSTGAALLDITSQTITGNIVTAANPKATSLAAAASPNAAITGNLIIGIPVGARQRAIPSTPRQLAPAERDPVIACTRRRRD